MNKKLLRRIFPLIALALLAPWPIAYAHDVSDGVVGEETVRIEVAEVSAQPTWTVFGKAIGGVTPGDLFYIDATDNPADIVVTLYLTNTQELISYYRYLILKVGVYAEDNGEVIPDTFITMRNGQVSFTLQGYANYKVTIDSGSFYCFSVNGNGGSFSPQFFLEVE